MKSLDQDIDTTTDFTFCLTCKEVGLICSEGLKRCFEGFLHPEIASEFNFDLKSHLCSTAQLATVRQENSG